METLEQLAEKVDRQQSVFMDIVNNLNDVAVKISKNEEQAICHLDFLKAVIEANQVSFERWK